MARVNVFLDDRLLEAVDAEASRSGMRRSRLVQEALRSYLEARRKAAEEEAARRRMDDACAVMDAVAEKLGAWDPVETIREFRDRAAGAPAGRRPSGKRRR